MWEQLQSQLLGHHIKAISRCITLVENEFPGYEEFLKQLPIGNTPVIGITGPPGAGKSTLTDALIEALIVNNKRVAVLCVDPSSPFNLGALLGDRIRMSSWYNHPNVYIRSLANRGSLGGLHPSIVEIINTIQAAKFDFIIVETVGVGQSEIEIAGLADTTIVVVVPEAGDEVQTMKSGIMEIANIFVVNKADRPDADRFVKNLAYMLMPTDTKQSIGWQIPVIKTVALQKVGIVELVEAINKHLAYNSNNERKTLLLTQKAFNIIQAKRMKAIDKNGLFKAVQNAINQPNFNIYQFAETYLQQLNLQ